MIDEFGAVLGLSCVHTPTSHEAIVTSGTLTGQLSVLSVFRFATERKGAMFGRPAAESHSLVLRRRCGLAERNSFFASHFPGSSRQREHCIYYVVVPKALQ